MFDDKDYEEQTALREDRSNLAETNATIISEEFQPSHGEETDPKLTDFSSEQFQMQSEEEKFQSQVEKVDEEWREIYKEA